MKKLITLLLGVILCLSLQAQTKLYPQPELLLPNIEIQYEYQSAPEVRTWWHKWGHPTFSILYQTTYHAFDAIGDAYAYRAHYQNGSSWDITRGKIYNTTAKTMMFLDYPVYVFSNKYVKFSLGGLAKHGIKSVGIRYISFDPIFNAMIGQPYNYVGNVSLTDKFWQEAQITPAGWWITRGLMLVLVLDLNYKFGGN